MTRYEAYFDKEEAKKWIDSDFGEEREIKIVRFEMYNEGVKVIFDTRLK